MSCPYCGAQLPSEARHCPECGRPLLTQLFSRRYALADAEGREFFLRDGISRIGRDPASNEIVLMDPSVSSRHAAIEFSPRSIIVRDLGSTHGTRLNGRRLEHAAVLQEGDRVTFGGRELRLKRLTDERPRPPRGIPTPIVASRPQVQVVETGRQDHFSSALATIALLLLATALQTVAIVDGFERDDLPLPSPLILAGVVVLPLLAIMLVALNRRSGYLVAAIASVLGLLFIAVTTPVFAGGAARNELSAEYGSNGFWFVAAVSIFALVVEILLLTVALAGWRVLGPAGSDAETAPV